MATRSETRPTAALDHARANELIGAYVDEMLGEDERAAMDAHLASCPECSAELEQLRGAVSSVSGLHRLSAPADFADAVKSRIRRRSRGRFFGERRRTRMQYELFSLVMLALLLIVYLVLRWGSPVLLNLQ